ncbi:MAG: T9SS type A sorting domain-containing protein [Crocinitomicaceae bacterium]|nr:T9SS type A sorting domain-containing protein [Crocinitomicaceae bacterium]
MKVILILGFLFSIVQLGYTQQSRVINFGRTDQSVIGWDGLIDNNGNHIFGFSADDHNGIAFIDANYNTIWTKNIGDAGARQVIQLENGKYINIGGEEIFSFDSVGTVIWSKRMPNYSSFNEILELDANNIIVSFRESGQSGIMSIDFDGNINWTKQILNPFGFELGIANIFILNDGNFGLITGIRESANVTKLLLSKIDILGNVIWQNFYQSTSHEIGISKGYHASNDDIYLVGHGLSNDTTTTELKDMIVLRLDNNGTYITGGQYGYTFDDDGYDIKEDKNNNFLVLGNSKPSLICGGNLSILCINSNLDTLYTKHYGTQNADGAYYRYLRKRNDDFYSYGYGSLWTSINDYTDCHVIKADENFELDCFKYQQTLNVNSFTDFQFSNSSVNYQNHTIIFTDSLVESTSFIQTADACTGELLNIENTEQNNFNIYPNPSNGVVTIEFKSIESNIRIIITDITGKIVGTYRVDQSSLTTVDVRAYPEGIYFVNTTDYPKAKMLIID